jgi:hypothetical protein
MGALSLPSRFNQQPQQAVPVDAGYPLARRLVSYLPLAGQVRDAVGGIWTVTNGTIPLTYGAARRGRGMAVVSASTPSYVARPSPAEITTATNQPLTLRFRLAIATVPTSGATSGILCWADAPDSGSPRYYARLTGNANGTGTLEFYYSTSGGVYRTPIIVQTGGDYILHHTFDGTTHSVYLTGAYQGGFTGAWTLNPGSFYIGRGFNAPVASYLVSDFALWDRALSGSEVRADAENPWQVFPAPRRLWAVASGGTTFSYTASGGFTLSGTAATVRSATKAATGGLQLSGQAATARGAVRSASGGFQLSGSAAQARGKAFTASGGISFSGAASILKGVARLASGGLTISGAATAIVTTATQSRIVIAAGGFALSGTAAVIRVCTRATSGGISFAGSAATSFQRAGAVIGGWINMARRRRRE